MNSKKIRPAPAYQEYASDMLANAKYRMMSLSERGLLDTMRKECWVNHKIPKNPEDLARYLGFELKEINQNLTEKVLGFFKEIDNELICSELEDYRQNQKERERKMSEGGRRGGKNTQDKIKSDKGTLQATIKPLRRDETSRNELSGGEIRLLEGEITNTEIDPWVVEYEKAPAAGISYLKASRG